MHSIQGEGNGARALGLCGRGKGKQTAGTRETGDRWACEVFIDDVLKPRFLPEIRPTTFNYCVDIFGKWHGGNYLFIQRFRSDAEDAIEP